jgi:hypothetical protein
MKAQIKQKEKEIRDWWNAKCKGQIQLVDDEYSTYDFEGDDFIVEVKHRFKAYNTKMIETMKLSNNYQQSQLKNKTFVYIVVDENGVSVFNISQVIDKIIKLPEHNKLMEHTHYWSDNKPKIMKLHRNLPKQLSIMWEHKLK